MPAIRYRHHAAAALLLPVHEKIKGMVGAQLLLKNGDFDRIRWYGFICEHGVRAIGDGVYGKLMADAVSNGSGYGGEWRDLLHDEFVLAWRVTGYYGETPVNGAYAVVGSDGWPIVMKNKAGKRLKVA
jgi:hypothetical protein